MQTSKPPSDLVVITGRNCITAEEYSGVKGFTLTAVVILFVVALVVCTRVAAQSPHPRLWITSRDVPRLRALSVDKTQSPLGFIPADAFEAIKKQAESYLNEKSVTYTVNMPGMAGGPAKQWSYTLSDEAPPRHDDYSHYPPWTGMSRAIETRLVHLGFVALVTGQRTYFDKARQIALHLCKWPGIWTDPSYGNTGACLDTSHLSNAVALFYDWCYDQLSPDERTLIRKTLAEKAVDGLRKAIPAYGAVGWPNGFAVLTSALGTCAVALQGEDDRSQQWLAESLKFTKEFCDNQGKDGGCMEGPGYGTYGADTLAKLLFVLDTADVRHSLLDHPFFVSLPKYSISLLCPNDRQHTGFGDCWFSQPFPLCMTLLARKEDHEAAWYLHEIGAVQCRSIEEFLTIAMKPEAFTAPKRPAWNPSRAFVDVGYASLRDGFSTQAAFMAFKCGPPEQLVGHNHYDHNSFQINFNGTWIATDPGYAAAFDPPDNKYGRCTFGHSTITLDVDDAYLKNMSLPVAGHDQVRLNKAHIVDHQSSNRFDYVNGSAAEAYSSEVGGDTCIHFWREGEGSGFSRIEGPRPTSTEWTHYEFSGVAPEAAAQCCLALQFGGNSGSVWYDDAEVLVDGKKLDLPNPGFEEGLNHWSPRNAPGATGKHEMDEQTAHSGKRSARMDAPGGYYYWLPNSGRLPISPGQKITARFWAKCRPAIPVMSQADREVLFIKPYAFVIRDTLAAPQPHAYSYVLHTLGAIEVMGGNHANLIAPGAARLEAHIFSPAGITLQSDVFPGAEPRGPYLNCATGKVASTTITSVLIARDAAFKLTNPGFESGMMGWIPRDAEGVLKNHVIDGQVAHSGRKSGRIDGPGGYYYTSRFSVKPGDKVTTHFWAKLDGKADRWVTIYWWNKGKLNMDATGQQKGPMISGTEWTQYEFTATIPPDAEMACVAFNYFGEGRAWYDDVEVAMDTGRTAMPPGEVTALQDGKSGVVVTLDGLRHLIVFRNGSQRTDVTLAGHRVTSDGAMACITLDPQGKPTASWMLEGTELRLDGKAFAPVRASSRSTLGR